MIDRMYLTTWMSSTAATQLADTLDRNEVVFVLAPSVEDRLALDIRPESLTRPRKGSHASAGDVLAKFHQLSVAIAHGTVIRPDDHLRAALAALA